MWEFIFRFTYEFSICYFVSLPWETPVYYILFIFCSVFLWNYTNFIYYGFWDNMLVCGQNLRQRFMFKIESFLYGILQNVRYISVARTQFYIVIEDPLSTRSWFYMANKRFCTPFWEIRYFILEIIFVHLYFYIYLNRYLVYTNMISSSLFSPI